MRLLGLRLDDHDACLCLYDNGKVSYIKTERIYQIKHHSYDNAHQWVIDLKRIFGLTPNDIDEIAVVADPLRYNIPHIWDFTTKKYTGVDDAECDVTQVEHHYAHALSACMYPETKYQFVFDGVGEIFQSGSNINGTVWSVFKNYKLIDRATTLFETTTPSNSFGVEYENLARHLNIEASHPEDLSGKLMSLQTFGKVNYNFVNYLEERLQDIKQHLTISCHPHNWEDFIGSESVANLTKLDFAASIHYFLQKQILKIIKKYAQPKDKILLTGGCAQNICWNTEIKKQFPNLLIVPQSADDGLAIGAMEFLRQKHKLKNGKFKNFPYSQNDYSTNSPSDDTIKTTAKYIADGKIVGWYQGNGEIGPRALGNRSILMNPMINNAKEIINSKVKHREDYRPFGATVLHEHQSDYFDVDFSNPYMLYLGKVMKSIPAITHVDGTCRFQTLKDENPVFRKLIEEFYKLTGIPLVLNTSLNQGGKPIAGSRLDALAVLENTELDVLVCGDEIIRKDS